MVSSRIRIPHGTKLLNVKHYIDMHPIDIGLVYWVRRGPVTRRLRLRVNGKVMWCGLSIKSIDNIWLNYIDAQGNISFQNSDGRVYSFKTGVSK